MNKLRKFTVFALIALSFCFCTQTLAQENKDAKTQSADEPSYEVLLQILATSNVKDGSSGSGNNSQQLSPSLGNVVRRLKTTFPTIADYRLISTYLNRVDNRGTIESQGIVQEASGAAATAMTPTLQNWTLMNVKRITGASGQNSIEVGMFNFGTKVPIQLGQNVVYENTGLKVMKLGLLENTPTVIGTLNAPKNNELIVLVLTVRPVAVGGVALAN